MKLRNCLMSISDLDWQHVTKSTRPTSVRSRQHRQRQRRSEAELQAPNMFANDIGNTSHTYATMRVHTIGPRTTYRATAETLRPPTSQFPHTPQTSLLVDLGPCRNASFVEKAYLTRSGNGYAPKMTPLHTKDAPRNRTAEVACGPLSDIWCSLHFMRGKDQGITFV